MELEFQIVILELVSLLKGELSIILNETTKEAPKLESTTG
jgi:hypothetical protein